MAYEKKSAEIHFAAALGLRGAFDDFLDALKRNSAGDIIRTLEELTEAVEWIENHYEDFPEDETDEPLEVENHIDGSLRELNLREVPK